MTVQLQTNVVTVEPARDRVLDLAAVPRRIRETGYRPGRMWLRAEGRFVPLDGGLGFQVSGWPSPLPVAGHGAGRLGPATIRAQVRVEADRVVLVTDDEDAPG